MIHTPECQANCPCCGGDWDCNCGAITFPPVPVAHDALCPWRVAEESDSALRFLAGVAVCECDLIAKVRDSQGTTNQMDLEAKYWIGFKHGQETGYKDALADAVQRVEALANEMRNWSSAETTAATEAVPDLTFDQWLWVQRGVLRSIAAIKGDQP